MTRLRLLALAPTFALAIACGSNFPPVEIIEKPRPLASMITIAGDTTHRAAPRPNETATFEMLVAAPGVRAPAMRQAGWGWVFVVCPAVYNATGVYYCDTSLSWWNIETDLAHAQAPTAAPFPNPNITFTVPDAETLGPDRDRLMVQGAICPGDLDHALLAALAVGDLSALQRVPNPCADKTGNGLFVSSPFPIDRGIDPTDVNHTPIVATVTYTADPAIGEQEWTTDAPPLAYKDGCRGQSYPEIPETTTYLPLTFRLEPGSRESYTAPSPIAGAPPIMGTDDPRVVGNADGGDFAIRFDNQRTDDQPLVLTWQPPQPSVSANGTLVRFWFVVHDVRSQEWLDASSWVTRALCIVPAGP